jgi:hypothetical protein
MRAMGTVVLQNCLDSEKAVPDLWSETCPAATYDANRFITTKVEDVSEVKVEEDPETITFPKIKADPEVNCMSVCVLLLDVSLTVFTN